MSSKMFELYLLSNGETVFKTGMTVLLGGKLMNLENGLYWGRLVKRRPDCSLLVQFQGE